MKLLSQLTCAMVLLMGHTFSFAKKGVEFDCLMNPNEIIELSSPVDGIVEKFYVERGHNVTKGQTIADLESSVEKAQVKLAEAKAQLSHDIVSRKKHMDYLLKRSSRFDMLYKNKTIALDDKEKIFSELALARAEYQRAQKNQAIAEMELRRAQAILSQKKIRSPIAGVIIERKLSVGETTEDNYLVRIAETNPVRVDVIVPSIYFGKIRKGMVARVIEDGSDHQPHTAKVAIVDKVIDPASGTFDVRLTIANEENAITSGLKCRVIFDQLKEPDENG